MADFLKALSGGDGKADGSYISRLIGSREGCFFQQGSSSVDVSVVCHDARCLDISPAEQAYVSVRDIRRREGEAFAQMNNLCNLRSLELDTTLLVRVWVDEVGKNERRVVGEVRIPLARLISQYNACLYHTWIAIESPGLHDSVSSLGIMDAGSEFDQAIMDGPKQLSQPKICLSLCRATDVPPSGKVLWSHDTSNEQKVEKWGPLLRSQQQHLVLSAALHLKCERQASNTACERQTSKQAQDQEHQEAMQKLQRQLDEANSQVQQLQLQAQRQQPSNSLFRTQPSVPTQPNDQNNQAGPSLSITQARNGAAPNPEMQAQLQAQSRRLADAEARLAETEAREHRATERLRIESDEALRVRSECDQLKVELDGVRGDLDTLSTEANRKIEAANDRIRTLRQRNSEAESELNQIKATTLPLLSGEKATLEAENRQLAEQKEALLRIVEDLHQTCVAAGIETAGRQSIDNMTCTITQEFRLT
jgi:hypothetical protein